MSSVQYLCYLPLYWLVNRDPYHDLSQSLQKIGNIISYINYIIRVRSLLKCQLEYSPDFIQPPATITRLPSRFTMDRDPHFFYKYAAVSPACSGSFKAPGFFAERKGGELTQIHVSGDFVDIQMYVNIGLYRVYINI